MDEEDELLLFAIVLLLAMAAGLKKSQGLARPWIRRRARLGAFNALNELMNEDGAAFRNFVRIEKSSFGLLLEKVTPLIRKQNTFCRDAIPPGE